MTPSETAHLRLISQQLTSTEIKTAPQMTAYFGAIQGQEYGPSKWGLGLRLANPDDTSIENDFTEGRILRTHLLRPTWHFVAAEDIRWLLMLTAPRVTAINQFTYRREKLTAADFSKCNKIIENALEGGKHLTRDALNDEFRKHRIEASGVRLVSIMMNAELEGLVCSGARQGKQFTYALLEERAPKANVKTRDESLAELALRYFTSRGPATIRDFSIWSGLALADCKKAADIISREITSAEMQNERYYFAEPILDQTPRPEQLYLLPIYDEMIMGYKNRDAIMQYLQKAASKMNIVFDNMMVYDGQIIGSWKRVIKNNHIDLLPHFINPQDKKQWNAFETCAAQFETFHNLPVKYTKP
jgi:hypothetical protein